MPDTIARFDYSHVNDKTQKRLELASELLWSRGIRVAECAGASCGESTFFDDLNKAQKLAVVGQYIEEIINSLAKEQMHIKKLLEANIAANAEISEDEAIVIS
jgi:hypothetical protein